MGQRNKGEQGGDQRLCCYEQTDRKVHEGCSSRAPLFTSPMRLSDVLAVLNSIAPFDAAEAWDNIGLQVGDPTMEVRSILVALDPTLEALGMASTNGCELVVTHHPLIMTPLGRIDLAETVSRKIELLLRQKLGLVCMHTNLDKAPGGTADMLAEALGLKDASGQGFLRVGKAGTKTPLSLWVEGLPFRAARLCDAGRLVETVGACPGSGMELWRQARSLGCDTYVTGDVRYHAALEAVEAGMNVVDLGHFATEEIVLDSLAGRLGAELCGIRVIVHKGRDVFTAYEKTNRGEAH